jgi:DNA repair protein RecN (Recombination protein N)
MLAEVRIRDLAVIADLELVLPAGMTAVTGETGAGKTMLVEAIELLVGGRADGVLVRAGAAEALVEGRFLAGGGEDQAGGEVILARAVPATGRSRGYIDGRMAPVSALAEAGAGLVDLHGQHSHQSLLRPAMQRAALDSFGRVDHGPLRAAWRRLEEIETALSELGGSQATRERELDLLGHQLAELDRARLEDPDEDESLEAEEDRLADATASRHAALSAAQQLSGEGGATDVMAAALAALARHRPLAELEGRLRSLAAEVAELAFDLRDAAELMHDDPKRLEAVRSRRALLRDLCRKYGDRSGPGSLAQVMAFAHEAEARLRELESSTETAKELERDRAHAASRVRQARAAVGAARRRAAPELAAAVEAQLCQLNMPAARFIVEVGEEDPGDGVAFLLGANPGEPALPLAKVASGGELSRAMLAMRLVLGQPGGWPPTMVFDEVDAGVGGEAALAVGRALASLATPSRQVLVVTHLPQVAAFADHQVAVHKVSENGRTTAVARVVEGEARVVELSRMLSGQPQSTAARDHAEELLAVAARERGR